jgi:putative nucleotidyltransferase with HDIG domain
MSVKVMFKEQILIVDDEKTILELSRRFLSGEGYSVEVASSGMEALKLMDQKPFHILLTDIRMPGMSGLELMKLVRSSHSDIIIVVITGHGTITTAIESLKLGAMGFILKPFTHQELISVVQHATQKTRLAQENLRLRSFMPLFEINRKLLAETDLENLLQTIVKIVKAETRADRVSLMLLDNSGTTLTVSASVGFSSIDENKLTKKVGEGIAGKVVSTGKPVMLQEDPDKNPEWKGLLEDPDITSALSLPLTHRKRVIGVLNLSKLTQAPAFTESDLELASILCGQASVAIENARLYHAIQNNHVRTLQALVAAIEIKDLFGRGHSSKVAKYASLFARKLGLSKAQTQELILASILHDIGKIGSSDELLSKPEKLTEEEFLEMKSHSEKAIKILKPIGLSDVVVSSIRHHHERWDGAGYPDGLAKEEIPLYSRIISIADTLDTLISERPYRKTVSFDEAHQEILSCSGKQFDPQLVDLFSKLKETDFLEHSVTSNSLIK